MAKAENAGNASAYFLKAVKQKQSEEKSHFIYTVAEKRIQQHQFPPVFVTKRRVNVQEVTAQKSSSTSATGCGNAACTAIPPFFVFAWAKS